MPFPQLSPVRFREHFEEFQAQDDRALRMVYIPTHRDCSEVLTAVGREVRTAADRSTDEFQIVLIDDRPPVLAENNRLAARRVAGNLGLTVNWLGGDAFAELLAYLVARGGLAIEERQFAFLSLIKPSGSYASGMNKASLLAAYLGASTLHRRDSDEFPACDPDSGVGTLEVEVATLSSALPTGEGREIRPYIAGSHVDGEPTKDHRDLISVSRELAAELQAIGRRPRQADEVVPAPVTGNVAVGRGRGIRVERDFTGRAQVGVSASREVYHWIPEMPAVGILGTDHFQKGLLYQLDLPVYWHPLGARHEYEPLRAQQLDETQLRRYAVAELRHVVLRHYWNAANELLVGIGAGLFDGGQFRSAAYAQAFLDVLTPDITPADAVADHFIDIIARAADLASGDAAERLRVRLQALEDERPYVVGYVRDSIEEFARLTRLWPHLVAAAQLARAAG